MPYATGAGGALLIAFSAVFVRFADVSAVTAAVYRCAYAVPLLVVIAALERRRLGPRPVAARVWSCVAGAFFAADLTLWHHSIALVGAGLATVLANVQVVIVALAAWVLLGERPRAAVLAAVPLVLIGVVMISGIVGGGAYGDDPVGGAVYGGLTAVAYSGYLLALRQAQLRAPRGGPAGPLLDATAVGAVGSVAIGLVFGGLQLAPTWPAHGWLLALALTSQVVAWLLITSSLPRLPAVVTSIVLSLQPVGSMVLGVVLLAEAPSRVQLAGVVVTIAGVVLATASRRAPPAALDEAPAG